MCRFNRKLLTICVILFFTKSVIAQPSENLESKAVNYLINNVIKSDKDLSDVWISYRKETEGQPSEVFAIVNTIMYANHLMKDSIPDNDYVRKLDETYKNTPSLNQTRDLNFNTYKQNKKNKVKFELHVFNAVEYRDKMYVELLLINRKTSRFITIIVKFDRELPVAFYRKDVIVEQW